MKNLIVILFFIPLFAIAQKTHTVTAKETLYSIGRLYNIHPKDLAAYNNIPFDKGLALGQVLKIPAKGKQAPLAALPVTKSVPEKKEIPVKIAPQKNETASITVPIYHKVAKKETLYHISTLYNKVPIADLKKWNHLTGDGVSEGTELIVGYKKGNKEDAVVNVPVITKEEAVVTKKDVVKPKEIPAKQPESVIAKPERTETKTAGTNPVTGKNFNGGFFKNSYTKQSAQKNEEKGQAGIFKSTSGWEDGKYYCLHNTAQPGSIIKITSTVTNKTIYAKVLDVIPDLKQNEGLILRLSNAAAEELGVGSVNFECTINY